MRHIGITILLSFSILAPCVMMGQIPARKMAPVAHAGRGQTVAPGSVAVLNGGKSWDANGEPLKFHWSLAAMPSGSRAVLQDADTVSPRLVVDLPGTYVARLVVNDGMADSAESLVTISTDNTAPVADAGSDRVVTAGSMVELNGAASTDVDGDMLTYEWSIVSAPEGSAAVLSDRSQVNPKLVMDLPGTYVAQLKVNDGRADSEPVTVTITSGETLRPVARAGRNRTVAPGTMVHLEGASTDPQGLPVKLQWALTSRPAGSSAVLDDAHAASPFFVADVAGTYIAQLVAHNGAVHSTPSTVMIATTDLGPVADAGPGREVAAGDSVMLDGSGSWSAGGRALQYSWAMLSRPLNSKAALSSSTGSAPNFVPDVPGAYVVQLMVSDGLMKSAPVTTLLTASALSITTMSLPDAQLGIPYSTVVTAAGGTPPYTWKMAGGRLPAGFSLDAATGTLSGTAQNTNAAYLTFMVTDSGTPPQSATEGLSLNVSFWGLQITTTSLPVGQKGVQYMQTLTAIGGIPPYTWSIATGTLPAGWMLFPSTGVISGVATNSVTNAPLTIRVTDSAPVQGSVTQSFLVNVSANPLTITTVSLPNGQAFVPYSAALAASGAVGTLTWQVTAGALPNGLTLNASTGLISGTPQGAVSATPLTIQVSDAATSQTATANLSLTITGGSLAITTTTLPAATSGSFYSQALQATGGTGALSWKITGGALPGGLTLGSDGTISGVPAAAGGPTSFTAQVTDSSSPAQTAQATLSVTVLAGPLTITTTSLPTAMVGVQYSTALTATGGTPPYSWSIVSGRLPGGFTFDSTGVIGGAAQFTDPANVMFRVTDSSSPAKSVTASFNLDILPPGFAILTTTLPDGQAGVPYAVQIQFAGGVAPYSWTVTSGQLPAGITLDPSTGLVSGTPTATGSGTVTIRATDSSSPRQVATRSLTLTIAGKVIVITTAALANGTIGVPYAQMLTAAGGTGGLTWQVISGALPAGLTLNVSTGLISGTPTAAAAGMPVSFRVTDSSSPALTATANFAMTIVGIGPGITTFTLPAGTVGTPYLQTLAATGGSLPYTWQLTAGTLPAGLTFSGAGVLSGTPTATATATQLTFKVTDGTSQTASATLALTIAAGTGGGGTLTVLTTSLPPALIGVPYSQTLVATGGTPPYTWSLPSGRLPGGFVLSPNGVISGTADPANQPDGFLDPLLLGFRVTDSSTPAQSATAQLVFDITKPALQITTPSLPGGAVGVPYSFTMTASGGGSGVYTWGLASGVLPAGLSLDPATGVINGTPTATMVRRVIISVTDPAPPPVVLGGSQTTVSASFTLQIQ
ncbi:MAG TPA: putative Ig domain-containing protein [Candidatus Solibacter sp.]